ncbi:MAG: hypothetical protein J5958_06545 [Clostridia bacterium]|nr:hypothetical protein [Clostridia bacterium]
MAGIIYSTSTSGLPAGGNAQIGKLETPIKMLIEHESDNLSKENGIAKTLFNIEKSNNWAETVVGMDEFGRFKAVQEGNGAPNDEMGETFKQVIEHIEFMKEFTITKKMMEDAHYGVAADTKRTVQNFVRSYYATQDDICGLALANGTSTSMDFEGTTVPLKAPDGYALFSNAHKYGSTARRGGTGNSNYFYANGLLSASNIEKSFGILGVKMRNIKGENGKALGYTVDTVIIPGNRGALEWRVKKLLGSEHEPATGNNGINIQYGNMNLVILPQWEASDDRVIMMSSKANKQIAGNIFYNRTPLDIMNWIDEHTRNYVWNGRCRFGVGFGSYKHVLLAVDTSSDLSSNATSVSSEIS